jgi:hypothetical protein
VSAHTPGPWLSHDVNDDGPDCGMWVVDLPEDPKATVHRLYFGDMETNTGRDLANADLVAAAPDLLDACRRLLTFTEDLCADVGVSTHYPSAEAARAAIAKATGAPG